MLKLRDNDEENINTKTNKNKNNNKKKFRVEEKAHNLFTAKIKSIIYFCLFDFFASIVPCCTVQYRILLTITLI